MVITACCGLPGDADDGGLAAIVSDSDSDKDRSEHDVAVNDVGAPEIERQQQAPPLLPDDSEDSDHDMARPPSPQPPEQEQAQPEPAARDQPPQWDVLFPRRNRFRDVLVQHALPNLWNILRDPANRLKPQRELVNKALDQCKASGNKFWGDETFDIYTRKRSAVDAILVHYFSVLQDHVAGRPVAPL